MHVLIYFTVDIFATEWAEAVYIAKLNTVSCVNSWCSFWPVFIGMQVVWNWGSWILRKWQQQQKLVYSNLCLVWNYPTSHITSVLFNEINDFISVILVQIHWNIEMFCLFCLFVCLDVHFFQISSALFTWFMVVLIFLFISISCNLTTVDYYTYYWGVLVISCIGSDNWYALTWCIFKMLNIFCLVLYCL